MNLRTLNDLPPEILSPIFYIVCTDGGRMANSLRLVCRATYRAANLHRFRIVSVAGMDALGCLVHEFLHAPPDLRNMEHLFVSDTPRSVAEDPRRANRVGSSTQNFAKHLQELLEAAGPRLRTLSVLLYDTRHMGAAPYALSRATLPALTTLTLRVAGIYSIRPPRGTLGELQLPALRALTLDLPIYMSPSSRYIDDFADRAPALERVALHANASAADMLALMAQVTALRQAHGQAAWPPAPLALHPCSDPRAELAPSQIASLNAQAAHAQAGLGIMIHPMSERLSYSAWRQQWSEAVGEERAVLD
jgi:hypothetical protein